MRSKVISKVCHIILCAGVPVLMFAQGNASWEARFHVTADSADVIAATVTDNAGNIYFTGYHHSGNISRGIDMTVGKIADGKVAWVALVPEVDFSNYFYQDQMGVAIGLDKSGNVIAAGKYGNVIIVGKFSAIGVDLWYRSISMQGRNLYPTDIAADDEGNIYICGYADYNEKAYYLLKLNSEGETQWQKEEYEAGNDNRASHVAVDRDNNVYVTGNYDIAGGLVAHAKTIKYDSSGNTLWENTDGDRWAMGFKIDSKGNLYVLRGERSGSLNYNILIHKMDAGGSTLWSSIYNSPFNQTDLAGALALDTDNSLYITGSIWNDTVYEMLVMKYDTVGNMLWERHFNPGNNTYARGEYIACDNSGICAGGRSYTNGKNNMVILKYDASGNLLWSKVQNQAASDYYLKGLYLHNGTACIAGEKQYSYVNGDLTIIRYDAAGTLLGEHVYNSYRTSSAAFRDAAIDDNGDVYVTGGDDLDLITAKYTESGSLVWQNLLKEKFIGKQIEIDALGNAYVVTGGTPEDGAWDARLVKYNPAGDTVFVKSLNLYLGDPSVLLFDEATNSLFITGRKDVSGLAYTTFTSRYSSNGDEIWTIPEGGMFMKKGTDGMFYVASCCEIHKIDTSGNVIFTMGIGWLITDMELDDANNSFFCLSSSTFNYNWSVVKITNTGNWGWLSPSLGSNSGDDQTSAIALDNAGNSYVTGFFFKDHFRLSVAKYSPSGDTLWQHIYETAYPDYFTEKGVDVYVDASDRIWVLGRIVGGELKYFPTINSYSYQYDIIVLVFDSTGNLLREHVYDGFRDMDETPLNFFFDTASASLYIVGSSIGVQTSDDAFLLKLPFDLNSLSMNEIKDEKRVMIYPNPTTSTFFIKTFLDNEKIKCIEVRDATGKLYLAIIDISANYHEVSTGSLPPGIYFVNVVTTSGPHIQKMIIAGHD